MIDKKRILIKVKSFLTEYFPHAYGAMITGSFLTEKFNETSDVDIIIPSNIFRSVCIDTYDYDGIKMQCIIFPVFDLESLIQYDLKNGGVFICQVSKGIILKDHGNIFENFKAKIQILYERGPAQISRFTLNQYRNGICHPIRTDRPVEALFKVDRFCELRLCNLQVRSFNGGLGLPLRL